MAKQTSSHLFFLCAAGANGGVQGTGTSANALGAHAPNAPGAGARALLSNGGAVMGSSVPEGGLLFVLTILVMM